MSFDWRTLTLGQLGKVVTGKTPKTSDSNNFGGAIPFVTPTDMDERKVIKTTARYLTEQGASTVKNSIVPARSIMVSCIGSDMGKSFIAGHRCVTNQQINSIIVDKQFNSEFIYYNLSMRKAEFQHLASGGSTMPILNKSIFSAVKIELPPLAEQCQIVGILESLDDRIALLRETNVTLEAIAQAMFKSWFVDFDPVRAKQEGHEPEGMDAATAALFPDCFEESELGPVPTGWRLSTLGAICTENAGAIQTGPFGSQLHASDYLDEGTPVVMPQDLGGRRIKIEKIARVGDADVSRLHRHQMRYGDIIFSRRGDVGRHALIGSREEGWLCGTGCLLVRAGKNWPSTIYLSLALDRTDAKEWLLRHAVGATMPNLNTGILSAVPIMQPDSAVLSAFDEIMRLLDDRISDGHARIHCLTELRDTLLPRLISGQLRLPDADALMKDAA